MADRQVWIRFSATELFFSAPNRPDRLWREPSFVRNGHWASLCTVSNVAGRDGYQYVLLLSMSGVCGFVAPLRTKACSGNELRVVATKLSKLSPIVQRI